MTTIVPIEVLIEQERKNREAQEGQRIWLELPLPNNMPRRREERSEPDNDRSAEIIDIYGEPDAEDSTDRGVTIISIFGD